MYIVPLTTSIIIGIVFTIIAISRDHYIKVTEINQLFAVGKIINLLVVLFISTILILLISLELADHFNINPTKIIANPKDRYTYITVVTSIILIILIIYISSTMGNLKSKAYYFVNNYCNTNRNLYILQRYKDKYICTYDTPKSYNRVLIDIKDLDGIELEYYSANKKSKFDLTNIFLLKSQRIALLLLIIALLFITFSGIFIIFLTFLLNYSLDFGSKSLLYLSISFSIIILIAIGKLISTNIKNTIKHFSSKTKIQK
ncbi:hypothetical protein QI122_08155 [Staphylococcus saprophyticus]|nr:hypothetical protein [Staphylococcus saprophyticus]